jgi:hypothetical protein
VAIDCCLSILGIVLEMSVGCDRQGKGFTKGLTLSFQRKDAILCAYFFCLSSPWFLALESGLHNFAEPLQSQTFSIKGRTVLEKRKGCHFKRNLKWGGVDKSWFLFPSTAGKLLAAYFSWISGGNSTNTIRCFVCEQVYLSKWTQWLVVIFHLIRNLYWHQLLQFLRVTS